MEFNDELIDHISQLAKLSFSGEEREEIKENMQRILDFMGKLEKVNTDDIEPLIYLSNEINILRDDEPKTSISHEEILLNAPKKDSDYIRIPKVLDKNS
ncbi:MAG: Asp-tRNA(Asn)/Glu-tRNA(Gln) amidotransferase subunit GatC [Brumimicrobium sp.]|nr:Asp-tRNA(Asn)/Glu-tRNA(Gln) amidotransferase subunit GatC [Brumimicrobium sp.]